MTYKFFSFCLLVFLIGCTSIKHSYITTEKAFISSKKPSKDEMKNWCYKDILEDSIPGISLEKAYKSLLQNKKGKEIIIAVLDSNVNSDDLDLNQQIWTNSDEIPNNNIDDDNNGYVDDIHGWNFLGTQKNGEMLFSHYSYMRFINTYKNQFENKLEENIEPKEMALYKMYKRAWVAYNERTKKIHNKIAMYKRIKRKNKHARKILKPYFPNSKFSIAKLDSLNTTTNNDSIKMQIRRLKYYIDHELTDESTSETLVEFQEYVDINLKLDYNEKHLAKDNPNDLKDTRYGNNNIKGVGYLDHGTEVVSVIAAKRNNGIGINGIIDKVKIMPLIISTAGSPHDKDIALAIRYAVNNGAKVINMSIGNEFPIHPEWIKDAIQYAEQNNVLLINASGNDNKNLDSIINYPNDRLYNETEEYAANFIKVGATSKYLDSTLVASYSNYGKKEVDIFAPGSDIKCLTWDEPVVDSGTSLSSAVVSGVAALIYSYYPEFTAKEVKQIILDSGISLDIMVKKPVPYGEKSELVPFSSLSKSGKIINAYNALLMADSISK